MLKGSDHDTIAAIATACGEGGVGIVRLSGKDALLIAGKIFVPKNGKPNAGQKSFTARYGRVVSLDPQSGRDRVVDEAILLVMRAPKSYTAEDVAEIQVHGGSVVLQEVLALAIRHGARLAEHGEFTKRAFLNGRIDLLQAEAVLDLIQAKTGRSLEWAAAQLEGSLSQKTSRMKADLLDVLSFLEASIDFPDDDLGLGDYAGIEKKLSAVKTEIEKLLSGSDLGILAKRGIRIALWGRPNTGKSSLMNCLARHPRVIVTPIAGTTRDVVEEEIQLSGFPVRLLDTAGIQDTEDSIEKEGVLRSRRAVMGSDLVLFVLDASADLDPEDAALYREIASKPKILVLNKSDLGRKINFLELARPDSLPPAVETSCETGAGIDALEKQILDWATRGKAQSAEEGLVSSVRQKDALEKMLDALGHALEASRSRLSPELVAVDVRLALDHLGALVGEIVTEDILEVLFKQFCIGK